ncbi:MULTISPECIES: diacylglycerol kinase [unclassified Cellulophaga]|uniref:diacylglycerol kinase n=1 Tax=unclassified Cellulophaga TaxID=2634405 RepID=UPI0026E2F476|nr:MULTISPECIES: diacylglycerol kinase family protein [unclassified Cellulophaga]MDO6491034.1 diacylglycerol kinase family protein [Cellulophaga sp. 2_MG-2023]MDO6493772.1 diacylglycerol kinase family protein [Cellulophaga sp. 3_MG-2023]
MPKENFVLNRIRSVGYALKGAFLLLKTEASIKVQFFICIFITIFGFYYNISNTEWILQIFAIGLVMGIEGVNTAIEKIADYIQPEFDAKIGFIKDVAAGAVMIVSIAASIIGCIIYIPKIFNL